MKIYFDNDLIKRVIGNPEKLPPYIIYANFKCVFCDNGSLYLGEKICSICKEDSEISVAIGIIALKAIDKSFSHHQNINRVQIANEIKKFVKKYCSFSQEKPKKVISNDLLLKCVETKLEAIIDYYINEYYFYQDTKNEKRYLSKITIDGLFGYNSFFVDFNQNNNLSVFYGANGLGKTTIFKMLNCILFGDIGWLFSIPFNEMSVVFMDGVSIDISKKENNNQEKELVIRYTPRLKRKNFDYISSSLTILDPGPKPFDKPWFGDLKNKECQKYLKKIRQYNISQFEHYHRIACILPDVAFSHRFYFLTTDRSQDNRKNFIPIVKAIKQEKQFIAKEFDKLRKGMNKDTKKLFDELHTVIDMSFESLPGRIKDYFPENISNRFCLEHSHVADCKFSVFKKPRKTKPNPFRTDEAVRILNKEIRSSHLFDEQIDLIDSRYSQFGPYAFNKDVFDFIDNASEFCHKFKKLKDEFDSFYDEDNPGRKRLIFDELSKRLMIEMPSVGGKRIEISELSSGEQNILTILFHLIFDTTKNAIILIDEPEISLHIIWQQMLADALYRLSNDSKNNMQVIVASHSLYFGEEHPETIVVPKLLKK